jgi:predicted nucleic acid-binding Zn ribbon protein
VFKGSGFYITDNRNGSSSNGATKNVAQRQNSEDKKDNPASVKTGVKTEEAADAA